jgi:hypothetical protein
MVFITITFFSGFVIGILFTLGIAALATALAKRIAKAGK